MKLHGHKKLLFIIGMTLLTAIAEEAIFRGIIFNKLLEKFNLFISMCLSAALFSILHLPITFTDAFIAFSAWNFSYIFISLY
ncbi:hypothetical protein CMV37_27770 [Bacillus cereus]|nr:hypothetical protein CMV37_27770 [Bacillus cereus]